jgi:predicted ArsR family transcriptional regulator
MTRLNLKPVSTEEIHAVLTDPDFTHTAKVVWTYIRAVADPQLIKPMAEVLGMAENTVWRSLTALEARGLVRKVSGVWMAETTAPTEEGR